MRVDVSFYFRLFSYPPHRFYFNGFFPLILISLLCVPFCRNFDSLSQIAKRTIQFAIVVIWILLLYDAACGSMHKYIDFIS